MQNVDYPNSQGQPHDQKDNDHSLYADVIDDRKRIVFERLLVVELFLHLALCLSQLIVVPASPELCALPHGVNVEQWTHENF